MCFLSVIIPTYNSEQTIEKCLNSIISQTLQSFEICIIDGASSDETLSKVNNFCFHFKNIRIVSEPDQGVYDAMNKGINLARGEWLYFLGSDDEVYDKDVFLDVFNTSTSKKQGVIYGSTYIDDDTPWAKAGQIYDGLFDIKKILIKNICHQSIFYRKELFQKFGNYNLQYSVCADWEINLRFFSKTEFMYLDRIIAKFYSGGLSSKVSDDMIGQDMKKIRKKTLKEYYIRRFISLINFI